MGEETQREREVDKRGWSEELGEGYCR